MTSELRSRRRFMLPLGLQRPNRSIFLDVMSKRSSDNGKRCSDGAVIFCLKASLLLGWFIPFLYWASSSPRPIELDINGIPSDLRLRKAALKEYHHHIKRKPEIAMKHQSLTSSIGGDPSTIADKFPQSETDSLSEKNTPKAINKQAAVEKGRSLSKTLNLSSPKPKSNTIVSASAERGTSIATSDLELAENELKIGLETIKLSRKDRLAARIGCDWKRGPQAILLEDTSNPFFKKGAFARFHGNAHPNIALHENREETRA